MFHVIDVNEIDWHFVFSPPFWRDPHIIYPSQLPPTMQSENELMRRIISMRYVQCTYIIFKEQLLNKLYN